MALVLLAAIFLRWAESARMRFLQATLYKRVTQRSNRGIAFAALLAAGAFTPAGYAAL